MKILLTCLSLVVVDGDTVRCDGEPLRLIGDGAPNVLGFDTPETWKPGCQRELQLGLAATDRMKELVRIPGLKVESSGARDRYGRLLATIRMPDGRSAGAIMIAEGHAVEWRPGYRSRWCG